MRTCLALLVVGLMISLDANEPWTTVSATDQPDLPYNIVIDAPLADIVVDMLRSSRTFRRQCRQLGTVRTLAVRVSVEPESRSRERYECNAKCIINRYRYGRVEAHVRLLTLKNAEYLIAHELEHVREYVEGMNYRATSVQYPSRVWVTSGGHYETARAIAAGDEVAAEILRYRAERSTATLARRAP
jgi:hypothetical protein